MTLSLKWRQTNGKEESEKEKEKGSEKETTQNSEKEITFLSPPGRLAIFQLAAHFVEKSYLRKVIRSIDL